VIEIALVIEAVEHEAQHPPLIVEFGRWQYGIA
jgi:hypothetical protein